MGGAAGTPPARKVRLQKLLAAAGIASRRHAEALIREGRVTVNGAVARLGDGADPERDDVRLDGERLHGERPAYWLVHKPVGVLTSVRDPDGRPVVLDLVRGETVRLFPVGRLDRDTSGLVLLTNDGALAHALLHPSHEVEREYRVRIGGRLDVRSQQRLARGVQLEDGRTAPARVDRVRYDATLDETHFHLTLHEGRKRQIRRSLQVLGHRVRTLERLRMGPLRLAGLAPGQARRLDAAELRALSAITARASALDPRTDAQARGKPASKRQPRKGKPQPGRRPRK